MEGFKWDGDNWRTEAALERKKEQKVVSSPCEERNKNECLKCSGYVDPYLSGCRTKEGSVCVSCLDRNFRGDFGKQVIASSNEKPVKKKKGTKELVCAFCGQSPDWGDGVSCVCSLCVQRYLTSIDDAKWAYFAFEDEPAKLKIILSYWGDELDNVIKEGEKKHARKAKSRKLVQRARRTGTVQREQTNLTTAAQRFGAALHSSDHNLSPVSGK